VVERARRAVGGARLAGRDLAHDPAGVAVDGALGELGRDVVMQPRPERLDVGLLVHRPLDVDALARALPPQPCLQHQDDLVQRPGALVVGRDEEQHPRVPAGARGVAHRLEALAHDEHRLGRPDRRGVLGEAGDLLRAHAGAGRDHELVVGDGPAAVELHCSLIRVHARDGPLDELHPPAMDGCSRSTIRSSGSAPAHSITMRCRSAADDTLARPPRDRIRGRCEKSVRSTPKRIERVFPSRPSPPLGSQP